MVLVYFSKPVPASMSCERVIVTSRSRVMLLIASQHNIRESERLIQRFPKLWSLREHSPRLLTPLLLTWAHIFWPEPRGLFAPGESNALLPVCAHCVTRPPLGRSWLGGREKGTGDVLGVSVLRRPSHAWLYAARTVTSPPVEIQCIRRSASASPSQSPPWAHNSEQRRDVGAGLEPGGGENSLERG